jgi:hypothetical protein
MFYCSHKLYKIYSFLNYRAFLLLEMDGVGTLNQGYPLLLYEGTVPAWQSLDAW